MSRKGEDGDEKLRAAIKKRVAKEERAFRMVEKMVLSDTVDRQFFLNAGKCITVSQYQDVVDERGISKLCGYPLCNNRLAKVLRQKYKISLKEHKVYDITERKNFCSNTCYKASKYYECQLSAEPVWMRDSDKPSVDMELFDESKSPKHRLSGSGEEIVIDTKFRQHSSCDKVQDGSQVSSEDTNEGLSSSQVTKLDVREKDHVCIGNDGDGDDNDCYRQANDDLVLDLTNEIKHLNDDNIGDETVGDDHNYSDDHYDNDVDDDVKNRSSSKPHSSLAQRTNPEQNASANPRCSSSRLRRIPEISVCENPTELDIDNTTAAVPSETDPATERSRSVNDPIPNCKERKDLRASNHQRRGNSKGKQQQNKSIETVDSRRSEGNSTFQRLSEMRLKSTVASEKDSSVKLSSGNSCGSSGDSDEITKRKRCVEVVHETLREWCSAETRSYCRAAEDDAEVRRDSTLPRADHTSRVALRDSDDDDDDVIEETIKQELMTSDTRDKLEKADESIVEMMTKKLATYVIDSKRPMSIRGKIVSQKLSKALSPILSRLGLSFADVSCDMTNILKTLRFTNTNIVLKPFQWTLIGLTIFITLTRHNTTLRELLGSRQKQFHSLLNDVAISEDDLNRLVDVLIPGEEEDTAPYEPPIASDIDQRKFNMEELD